MKILVSACLLGICCRFDGKSKPNTAIIKLIKKHELIPVCPEIFGGLMTPRAPAERIGEKVIAKDGADVTEYYTRGADEVMKLAKLYDANIAILKERSPSCGNGIIYDGSFSGTLVKGDGILTEKLKAVGITVIGESRVSLGNVINEKTEPPAAAQEQK